MKKNKVNVFTLGCSKNLVDSERLMQQFKLNGYQVSHDEERVEGELVIVNTCGFIGDAQEESINKIIELGELKRKGKIGKLIVMGCLSERFRSDLEKELPEVDRFYGKFDWNKIITDLGKSYYRELDSTRMITTPQHYAYIKIAEGCDRTCSYCSIPIITGKYHSRSVSDIVEEVKQLTTKGVKEFQLIAQDLTYYGYDLNKKALLPELLNRLADLDGVDWIRLHYAYPTHFPYDILPIIRERDNICNYLDVALQHISTHVLSLMRRNITKEQTIDFVERVREEVPGIHLRTTMMVGHPGETEDDFEELIDFIKTYPFERLGAFAYSHEQDTYCAKHYQDDVDPAIKIGRLDRLMDVQERVSTRFNEAKIGKVFKTIIDKEEDDFYIGRTQYDSPEIDPEVLIEKSKALNIGSFYEVEIKEAYPFDLVGIPK